jgi:MinD superfamily P-loop ATPase
MTPTTERFVVAVASGKGGTGKTTVATGLAVVAADAGLPVQIVDCDVEAPNVHLFLKPEDSSVQPASVQIPQVDESKCDECGKCGEICQYSAIISLKTKPLVFAELCHGCGGCAAVCPQGAITEVDRQTGTIREGMADAISCVGGTLNVGEAMAPPVIRQTKKLMSRDALVILDAPPGASCPVVTAVRGADMVLLVAESTPFGLNDLEIAVATMRKLVLPIGVVINRASPDRDSVRMWCAKEGVEVVAEIADDRNVAEVYATGGTVAREVGHVRSSLERVLAAIQKRRAS